MRHIVIGAGAIGGTVGAELAAAGQEVVLVARGAHLEALRSGGLRYVTPRGVSTSLIPAVAGPGDLELRRDDVLHLCVKSQDTLGVVQAWAGRPVEGGGEAGELLPLFCLQNGVENERLALRWFARVYAVSMLLPAGHVEPGVITATSDPLVGVFMLGCHPAGTDRTADEIGALFSSARLDTTVVPDVLRWKYAKLLWNLGNAVEALCGPLDADEDAGRLVAAAVREGRAVLAAAGIEVAPEADQDAQLRRLSLKDVPEAPRGGGSSWQSMVRGTGSIETDYLNGEIVLLARQHGVPAPVNERLQRLAARAAAQGHEPGSVSAGKILAELPSVPAG